MNFFAFAGEMVKGRQARNAIDSQRDIEQFNIKVAQQNAELTAQQASAREEEVRRQARQALGAQRAAIGQSGVGFSGSSADIIRQSTTAAELDALNVRYAGNLERMGFLNEVAMRTYNDKLLKVQGKQAMRVRWLNAFSGLVGGQSAPMQTGSALPTNYGQGAKSSFGNNVSNFTSGSGGGFTGSGLSGGYGSIGGYKSLFGGG